MPRLCAVLSCPNHKSKSPGDTIHSFPVESNSQKRKCWVEFAVSASGGKTINSYESYGICSRHFKFEYLGEGASKRLRSDAIPTIFLGSTEGRHGDEGLGETYDLLSKIYKLERAMADLKKENDKLMGHVKELTKEVEAGKKAKLQLDSILARFTPGIQRKLLINGTARTHWGMDDITAALKLYNISTKAYEFVRGNLLPLPGSSVIRKHLAKMVLQPDKPIQSVFSLLNANFIEENYYSLGTICVLALDEMSVDSRYVYDKSLDQVFGGVKNVTLFCARGVFSDWKQPLMYSFDGSTEQILQLTKLLYENGLKVVGVISDMGPKNVKMWRNLGIAKVQKGILSTTHFPHPIHPNDSLYWFTDFPHLLKRLRDHLLDSSITLPGGTILNRSWIQELIFKQKDELKLTFKLGLKNLYLRGQERQNCSTAYQLFSHTVATATRLLMKDREGFGEVADFIDMINDLSDLFNSRFAGDQKNKFKTAYGMFLEEQDQLLDRATTVLMNCKIGARQSKAYAPFQKGFLILIKSTKDLFQDLRSRIPGMKYMMLSRFNQDFLENVFSILRGFGGFNPNPNCVDFKYRLRKLVVMWNLNRESDLSVDYDTLMRELKSSFAEDVFADIPEPPENYCEEIQQQLLYVDPDIDPVNDFKLEVMEEENIISEGSMEYIAGFIATRLRTSHPELSADLMDKEKRDLWVAKLSKGGLIEPSRIWSAYFHKFEDFFRVINPSTSIDMDAGVMNRLASFLSQKFPEVPLKVVQFYSRCRVYIRIKYLNKRFEDGKYLREHQRFLALKGEGLDEPDEIENDVEELSYSGEQLLAEFLD